MRDIWVISDTHFNHANICKFTRNDDSPLRPWDDVDEMDAALIENWNSVVKPHHVVYHLGDLTMHRQLGQIDHILSKLQGDKRLILGNHDKAPMKQYLKYFKKVMSVRYWPEKLIFSHYPLHPNHMGWGGYVNVHGHIHYLNVEDEYGDLDGRYFNASVECINYTPVHFDELVSYRNEVIGDSK